MTAEHSIRLQRCLERLQGGDRAAGRELLEHTCDRLTQLAHLMLRNFPRLRRWEETGDVVQNAALRLCRALETVTPPSLRDYYRLATLQIRRELLDLVRHHYGPHGEGGRHETNAGRADSGEGVRPAYDGADRSHDPDQLAAWTEFHRQTHALPEEEREVFDLVYYQAMSPTEAAAVLSVSPRTVTRRWQAACLQLHEVMGGRLPGM